MTEITDQDRHAARVWAKNWQGDQDDDTSAAARVILATVDAPPRTLAEELQYRAALLDNGDPDGDTPQALRDLATRAVQMEHDLAEARVEVERLTAVNENLRKTDNYREFREQFLTVQKGAESNAETTDPADVKPGEAWIVECRGERRTAVKDHDDAVPWCTFNADGWFLAEDNEEVTLVTRLVPAPRVITNPDELERLPHNSVILSDDNDAWQKSTRTILWSSPWWDASHGGPAMWPSERLCDEDHPVTVLWEPEA